MLYSILKSIFRLSLSVFFKKFNVIGLENIPKSGPVIFVANHPSAVMDPLIVGTILKKKIHFLAGAEWMGDGFKANFYKKHFNMIPVHRPWLAKGEKKVSNDEMFNESFKNLDNNDWVLIFPEAITKTVSKIRDLKTGVIRIKDGFEKYKNYEIDVPIIPIGINYSNPHRFQSDVVVNIGKAIDFKGDYKELDEKEKLRAKTNKVKEALEDLIINIDKDDNKSLVKKVNQLLRDSYKEEKGSVSKDIVSNFRFLQKVSTAVTHFEGKDPSCYQEVSARINAFFEKADKIGFKTDMISTSSSFFISFIKFIFLVLGFVPALFTGVLLSVPYFTSTLVFKKKLTHFFRKEESEPGLDRAFTGSLIFLSGVLIYLVWTLIISISISTIEGQWVLMPISMLGCFIGYRFSLFYSKIAFEFYHKVKGLFLKRMFNNEYKELSQEKTELIGLLREYQVQYSTVK